MTKNIRSPEPHIIDDLFSGDGVVINDDSVEKAFRALDLAQEEEKIFRKARRALRKETHKVFSLTFEVYYYAISSPHIFKKLKELIEKDGEYNISSRTDLSLRIIRWVGFQENARAHVWANAMRGAIDQKLTPKLLREKLENKQVGIRSLSEYFSSTKKSKTECLEINSDYDSVDTDIIEENSPVPILVWSKNMRKIANSKKYKNKKKLQILIEKRADGKYDVVKIAQ
ncbi:hypothetical protein GCM10011497_14930 [Elstera cyanobacteriorum]|uniref:hypothetical protein n=1 Tax=Elstera cyanobacteriorum TaxID=2022747 RepID=UPI00113FC9A1|nr:hypothetical protein [Elstera cyanobacteriorum]GFZ86673.1 hypothetical protein GCM10011497_14930 [Elstera cyanobacteriorum]